MNRAFSGQGFSGHRAGFGFGSGMRGPGMGEVFDQLRAAFEDRGPGRRMARGDVRSAVLALLAEQPMHGYQIITEIAQRSDGAWKPSAGSVYPTLQQLADEGLVVATESEGRKTYTLTDAGRDEAEQAIDAPAPWELPGARGGLYETGLPQSGISLAQATAQVARTGTADQIAEAVTVLDEARRSLYTILAKE